MDTTIKDVVTTASVAEIKDKLNSITDEGKKLLDRLNSMDDNDLHKLAKNGKGLDGLTPDAINGMGGMIPDDIAKKIMAISNSPKVKPKPNKTNKDKRKAKLAKKSKKRNRRK